MPRKEPCLAAAEKAEAEAATDRPTAQQKRDRISELEERARLLLIRRADRVCERR